MIVILDPLDVGPAGGELLLEPLVAAVEMIDAVQGRLALGGEAGDGERHRGAQVGRHDVGAAQPRHAAHQGRLVMDGDVGAHAHQLGHMHEAALEDRLGDHRRSLGAGHQRHHLRLQVGREAGIGLGHHIDAVQAVGARHAEAAVGLVEHHAGGAQRLRRRLHQVEPARRPARRRPRSWRSPSHRCRSRCGRGPPRGSRP